MNCIPPPVDRTVSTLPPAAGDPLLDLTRLRMTADNAVALLRDAYARIAQLEAENARLRGGSR